MKITKLKLNDHNPRTIKDTKFTQLVRSIENFPKMMQLRPIVVDEHFVILGGNMRYRACVALGMKEIPDEWVKVAKGLTEEEKRRFTIEDNVQFGDWDWDVLANEWDTAMLIDFGVDLPAFTVNDERPDFNDTSADKGNRLNAKDGTGFMLNSTVRMIFLSSFTNRLTKPTPCKARTKLKAKPSPRLSSFGLTHRKGSKNESRQLSQ